MQFKVWIMLYMHPSIYLSTYSAVVCPSWRGMRGRLHPGQVASPSQGNTMAQTLTYISTADLE